MGEVELATVSFGQSFQITPIQLAATVSSLINGGTRITPHFGVAIESSEWRNSRRRWNIPMAERNSASAKISETVRYILEKVVAEGSGQKCSRSRDIGSAERQQLPRHFHRSANRYISSFLGFAPADDPQGSGIVYYP